MNPYIAIVVMTFSNPVDCQSLHAAIGANARVVTDQPLGINFRCEPYVPRGPVVPIPESAIPPAPIPGVEVIR